MHGLNTAVKAATVKWAAAKFGVLYNAALYGNIIALTLGERVWLKYTDCVINNMTPVLKVKVLHNVDSGVHR